MQAGSLLLATHNPGKIDEYRRMLSPLAVPLTDLASLGITTHIPETGHTFRQNALLKARAYAGLSGLWTWADDSGLEVDLLEGRPGVHSARYAGADASDGQRIAALLAELREHSHQAAGAPWTARFRCVVAISIPDGPTYTRSGSVDGQIVDPPRGQGGFGYDPIFYLPELGLTMAELSPTQKNRLSHRGQAARAAAQLLARLWQTPT